jgi:type IV pilus assembly protein PilQ
MRSKISIPFKRWTTLIFLLWVQSLSSQVTAQAISTIAFVEDVSFKTSSKQTVVTIKANRAFDYTSYYPNPRLFILDIPGAQSRLQENSVAMKTSLVDYASITRIGEGERFLVRIEFNLNQPIQYTLHSEGATLRINFQPVGSAAGQASDIPGSDGIALSHSDRETGRQKSTQSPAKEDQVQRPLTPASSPRTVQAMAKSQTPINDVAIEEDDQQIQFLLQTTGKPSFKHFQLAGPNRLVIDVDSSSFRMSRRAVEVHSDLIRRVRFGYGDSQGGKLVRCVFDLSRDATYKISGTDSGIIVQFAKGKEDAAAIRTVQDQQRPQHQTVARKFESLANMTQPSLASAKGLAAPPLEPEILASDAYQIPTPEALTAPMTAPFIEGTVPMSEIDISRREPDLKVSDSPMQLAELLPPPTLNGQTSQLPPSVVQDSLATGIEPSEPVKSETGASLESSIEADQSAMSQSEIVSVPSQTIRETQNPPESDVRAVPIDKAPEATLEASPQSEALLAQATKPALSIQDAAPVQSDLNSVSENEPISSLPNTTELKSTEAKPEENTPSSKSNEEASALVDAKVRAVPSASVTDQNTSSQGTGVLPLKGSGSVSNVKPADTVSPAPATTAATPIRTKHEALPAADKAPAKEPKRELALAQLSVPAIPAAVAMTKPGASHVIAQVTPAQAPKYSGEPFNLELKDADLKDFFHLIGDFSGLNVVLDPDVKGNLTIFLKDVPWDQALDVVLKNNGLGKQLDGNVLRIATNQTLEAEETQRKRLSDARILAAELQTETRVLNYAKAADLSQVLKKILSPRGDIIVDSRTNSMIISDVPGKFTAIDALIKQLDKKIKQVEIEARVISATRDFLRDIGVQVGALIGNNAENKLSGAIPGNPFSRNPPPSVTIQPGQSGGAPNSLPLISNLGANAATSGLAFFGGFTHNVLVDTIITAAERRGTAKLLSKPKIITQENIEGFVQQGVKIPVQTTINNTISVQFFDFALKLRVTPQITDEGTISMVVNVENSTPDFSRQVQGVPTVNTQETRTTVLVDNGGTVVIGGVLVDNEQTNLRQVPGVGSLPLIGNLFKNRSVTKQTQELIFFISPKIL